MQQNRKSDDKKKDARILKCVRCQLKRGLKRKWYGGTSRYLYTDQDLERVKSTKSCSIANFRPEILCKRETFDPGGDQDLQAYEE